MASGTRKWLVGCGIGCGFMILAAGGIGTCGYVGVQKIRERADRMDEGFAVLREEYGKPSAYVPPADGVPAPDRLETFLDVRAAMAPARDELAGVLTELDTDAGGPAGVLGKIRAVLALLPRLFDFVDERNAALAEQGMGVGEYLYIYSLAYYSWLGHDPGDGPGFAVSGGDEQGGDAGFRWDTHEDDPERVREERAAETRRYLNGLQETWLQHQLEAARVQGLDDAWVARLAAEREVVALASERLMWEQDVPAPIALGLEPWRGRLEEAYSPVMNVVEIGMADHD